MLAAQFDKITKDISQVKLRQVAKPTVSRGMALIRVAAAAVNPADVKVMNGAIPNWPLPLPHTLGYDLAGVVEEIGDDETGKVRVGDRVFCVNWGKNQHSSDGDPIGGAFAEYALIPIRKLSQLPEAVSFEQGAAIALVGTTAYQALFDCAEVTSGSKILVLGGAGAVGTVAIQLAKAKGAWVATTASTRNVSHVSQFKPDLIIDYTQDHWWENPELKGIDAVLDMVGEEGAFGHSRDDGVLKPDGRFVSIANFEAGFDPKGHPPLSFASFFCLYNDTVTQDFLANKLADGSLHIPIAKVHPFTEEGVHDTLRETESGKAVGKIVIRVCAAPFV